MTETWTPAQWKEYLASQEPTKRGKSRAKKSTCILNRHPHGSKSEALECDWHFARVKNKEIRRAKWQVSVEIRFNGKLFKRWKIDFLEEAWSGEISYWECKGWNFSNRDYAMRRDAFVLAYPGTKLYINRELWTGKPKRKSLNSRVKVLAKRQEAARKARRSFRDVLKARQASAAATDEVPSPS